MYKRQHPERFSLRCRDRERFVEVAISPDLLNFFTGTSTRPPEGRSSQPAHGSTTTTDAMEGPPREVRGGRALPRLAVVAETAFPNEYFRSKLLYLEPGLRDFMVPRLIDRSAVRITKLLWENVTWVGRNMKRKEVSCLITVTEHDVCLGEVSDHGDLSVVCRVESKFPIIDCTFQPWGPRIVYVSHHGAGTIELDFELGIKAAKHKFHVIFDDKSSYPKADSETYLAAPRPKASSLTCVALTSMRNEVLVGDNRGIIFTFGSTRGTFTRHRQLTFPFSLASLAIVGGQGPLLFLAGLAAAPSTTKTLASEFTSKKPPETSVNPPSSKTSKTPSTTIKPLTIITSTSRTPKSATQTTSVLPTTQPLPAAATTAPTISRSVKPRLPGLTPTALNHDEFYHLVLDHITNAGILRVDLSLATPPVFQAVGDGHVVRMAWYRDSRQPLFTIVDNRLGVVHYKVREDMEKKPVKAFAVIPLGRPGGRAVWGSGGWLALLTEEESVLIREPAILAPTDSP